MVYIMNTHLTFADRVKIQYLIENDPGTTAISLSESLIRTRGTIYYELKNNTTIVKSSSEIFHKKHNAMICSSLSRFPFCCNRCPKSKCTHKTRIYNAYEADYKATSTLRDARSSTIHMKKVSKILNERISPLIIEGQSIDVALHASRIKDISSSTVRRYIEKGHLTAKRHHLPYAVRFHVKKEYHSSRTKVNPRVLYGRTYDDYLAFIIANPTVRIVQLDSVIGKANDKQALLTIFFMNSKFQFAFKYTRKNSNVNTILNALYEKGLELGIKLFDVILTDNGSEFARLCELETDGNNTLRFKVFYCDPYCSYQKAECEKNHTFIRRKIKKGISLDQIPQNEFDITMSHINSYPRVSLKYHSPYTLFVKEYNSIILDYFNIIEIESKKIKLK